MDDLMRDNLEDYLSGTLRGDRRAQWESYLANNPEIAEEVKLYQESAALLRGLRAPEGEEAEPAPGFYARVMQRVEDERSTPFWMVFLQPSFVRQLAFASLMWVALMGAYAVMSESPQDSQRLAEVILTEEPSPEYNVRLGTNLDQNRNSMLVALMSSGESR